MRTLDTHDLIASLSLSPNDAHSALVKQTKKQNAKGVDTSGEDGEFILSRRTVLSKCLLGTRSGLKLQKPNLKQGVPQSQLIRGWTWFVKQNYHKIGKFSWESGGDYDCRKNAD